MTCIGRWWSCDCAYCRDVRRQKRAAQRAKAARVEDVGPVVSPGEAWLDRSACRGKPLHWFFPSGHPRKEVVELCASCPVRVECDAAAVANDEQHGIWAGLNRDRKRHRLSRTK